MKFFVGKIYCVFLLGKVLVAKTRTSQHKRPIYAQNVCLLDDVISSCLLSLGQRVDSFKPLSRFHAKRSCRYDRASAVYCCAAWQVRGSPRSISLAVAVGIVATNACRRSDNGPRVRALLDVLPVFDLRMTLPVRVKNDCVSSLKAMLSLCRILAHLDLGRRIRLGKLPSNCFLFKIKIK